MIKMTIVVKPSYHGFASVKKKKKSPTYLPNICPTRSDLFLEKVQGKNLSPSAEPKKYKRPMRHSRFHIQV